MGPKSALRCGFFLAYRGCSSVSYRLSKKFFPACEGNVRFGLLHTRQVFRILGTSALCACCKVCDGFCDSIGVSFLLPLAVLSGVFYLNFASSAPKIASDIQGVLFDNFSF